MHNIHNNNLVKWWKKYKTFSIAMMLIGLITGTIIFSIIIAYLNGGPVTLHTDKNTSTKMVNVEGDKLYILYQINHIRDCPISTNRFLWTWYNLDNEKIKLYIPISNENTTITSLGNNQKFILVLPLPKGIWNGDWFYYDKTINQCAYLPNWLQPKIAESRDLPLKISLDNLGKPVNIQLLPGGKYSK